MLKKLLTILLLCALPLTGAMGEIVSLSADGAPGLRYDYDRYATENGYEDPSISVTIYNGQMEETKYIYALVKIAQPNQLRTALAYKVNSSRTYKPCLLYTSKRISSCLFSWPTNRRKDNQCSQTFRLRRLP